MLTGWVPIGSERKHRTTCPAFSTCREPQLEQQKVSGDCSMAKQIPPCG
jgi:hypothetical protein